MTEPTIIGEAMQDTSVDILDRGDLPLRVVLVRDIPKHGLATGAIFVWSDDLRAYFCAEHGVCVFAFYVRRYFFDWFNWAGPEDVRPFGVAV